MLMGKWQKDMKSRKIPFTTNLNVTGMLVDAATVNIDYFDTIHQMQFLQSWYQSTCSIIGEHVVIIFVTQYVTIATVLTA